MGVLTWRYNNDITDGLNSAFRTIRDNLTKKILSHENSFKRFLEQNLKQYRQIPNWY